MLAWDPDQRCLYRLLPAPWWRRLLRQLGW
jgi:hypothetical protein